MVALIGELYTVERSVRGAAPAIRQAAREARSRPILDTIKQWLDTTAPRVLPKGLLGRAIGYALGQWPTLTTFLDDGRLEIDNNTAENCIRPFVTGRNYVQLRIMRSSASTSGFREGNWRSSLGFRPWSGGGLSAACA